MLYAYQTCATLQYRPEATLDWPVAAGAALCSNIRLCLFPHCNKLSAERSKGVTTASSPLTKRWDEDL